MFCNCKITDLARQVDRQENVVNATWAWSGSARRGTTPGEYRHRTGGRHRVQAASRPAVGRKVQRAAVLGESITGVMRTVGIVDAAGGHQIAKERP
jgi:hypothetical protein